MQRGKRMGKMSFAKRKEIVKAHAAEGSDNPYIATAYQEIPECETMIGDIKVKLFHRIAEVKKSDIAAFEARLYK